MTTVSAVGRFMWQWSRGRWWSRSRRGFVWRASLCCRCGLFRTRSVCKTAQNWGL